MNFSNAQRTPTVSGSYVFNIQLDHKYSGFNPKTRSAIDMEEVSSGIFGLKRIATMIEHLDAETVKNFYKKNKLLPSKNAFKFPTVTPKTIRTSETPAEEEKDPAPAITAEQIKQIQAQNAPELLNLMEENFPKFVDSVTEVDLHQMTEIAQTIIDLNNLKGKEGSLSEEEVQKVLKLSSVPTEEKLKEFLKTQKAETLKTLTDELTKKLEEAGIEKEEIEKQVEIFTEIFLGQCISSYIDPALTPYRETISKPLAKISKEIAEATKNFESEEITKDNLNETNARILLNAIASALNNAIQSTPSLATDPEIMKLQNEVWTLQGKNKFENDDIEKIYNLSNDPTNAVLKKYLPPAQLTAYRNTISQTYQTLVLNIGTAKHNLEDQIQILETQLSTFQSAKSSFNSLINNILAAIDNTKLTSRAMTNGMQAYSAFINLSQMKPYLDDKESAIIDPFFSDNGTNAPNGSTCGILGYYVGYDYSNEYWPDKTIASMIAVLTIYQLLSEYLLGKAVLASETAQVTDYLKKQADEITTYSYFSEIKNAFTEVLERKLNAMYQTGDNGFLRPRIDLLATYFSDNTEFHDTKTNLTKCLQKFNEKADPIVKDLQEQIHKLQQELEKLTPDQASFLPQRHEAIDTTVKSYGTNLGAAFWSMVVNNQLPRQKILLDPLIKEINFNNTASNALNSLLRITSDFSTSAVYYNFSSYLIQSKEGNDLFAGNFYETAIARATERENIARDMTRCKQAVSLANDLLKKIETFPNVTDAQREEMKASTAQYLFMLSTTTTQLVFLENLLAGLNIEPQFKSNEQRDDLFKITGPKDWLPSLAALEGFVTNGYNDVEITGGLGPIFTQIQADQQNYTTQSQTQQLNLQNQMTGIQQEWTVVSSALQVWNSIITALSGQIYE